MLILARKINERIIVNDSIVITVVKIRGNHVCIGIEAPRGISIDREEIWISKKSESSQIPADG